MITEAPANWLGSLPEYAVFLALTRMKVDFEFQSAQMGGRLTKGGAVVDFFIPSLNLALNVQSNYWHYSSAGKIASDKAQRITLEGMGIQVIWIQEEDALRDPFFYVAEALKGREHLPAWV